MKSLNTVQKISKIGKIISKIVYICAIIGVIGCITGGVSYWIFDQFVLSAGGINIQGFIESQNLNDYEVYMHCLYGGVTCLFEMKVAAVVHHYFKGELEDGHPLVLERIDELKKVGIKVILYPFICMIVNEVIIGVFHSMFEISQTIEVDMSGHFGLGLGFIMMSVVLRYCYDVVNKEA